MKVVLGVGVGLGLLGLSVLHYRKIIKRKTSVTTKECCICYEATGLKIQQCDHYICKICYGKWKMVDPGGKTLCPICRGPCSLGIRHLDYPPLTSSRFRWDTLMTKIYLWRFTRRCPRCSKLILKDGGCADMHCWCGYSFCWICGKPGQHYHLNMIYRDQMLYPFAVYISIVVPLCIYYYYY